ncbi:matrix metalloproteinase-19-like [Saccostrea echinata]|uniref:matrix metalloproteinase-19-like n=1 Tax=Saccostrea echinata TaxID=191078 RepID=UPI002A824FCC|nr:matrix metalloproteinase-19-like [Saccostrea echinata]
MTLTKIVVLLALTVLSIVKGEKTTAEIEKYLCKYGYLTENCNNPNQLARAESREYAIKWWQMFSNLPVTGVIGPDDEELMNKRRCACEDVMAKDEVMNPELQPQQFNLGPKWRKTTLTWRVTKFSNQLDPGKTRSEITRALRYWSDVTPLRFYETSGDTDITISFEIRNHGDGAANAFDGPSRVLAHAFFPSNGRVHFDEEESWGFGDEVGNSKTDFFTVAVHEFGHTLGLFHSDIQGALMFPYYAGYNASFRLHEDDIDGIQSLYGPSPRTPPTTPRRLTTFRPTTQAPRPRITSTPRPRITPAPTVRPTRTPTLPSICNVNLRAMIRDFDGTLFAFVDSHNVMRITERGLLDRFRVSNLFRRAPWNTEAAYNIPSLGRTYFMRGQRIWEFDRMRNRMATILVQGGPRSMPERPRAAISTSASGNDIEVFGSGIMWRMKMNGEVVPGSHRYIRNVYNGVPEEIDAAVRWDSNTIYFFKDNRFYKYDTRRRRMVLEGDFGPAFLKGQCGNAPR